MRSRKTTPGVYLKSESVFADDDGDGVIEEVSPDCPLIFVVVVEESKTC
jgi:hypothetical protein